MGNTDIEDAVQKLDALTQEEARIASAELMKITHGMDGKVMGVDDRVKRVDERVQDVGGDVQDVGDKVDEIDGRVQGLGSGVKDIGDSVQGVGDNVQRLDHKLDHANSSSSYNFPAIHPEHSYSYPIQGTSSEIVFCDGFRPPTHPSIITLLARYINKVQLNGFLKEVSSNSGNPLVHSCGYTENVSASC